MNRENESDKDSFQALVGSDVTPLGNKGERHLAAKSVDSPGKRARRQAAAEERPRQGNFLDPVASIEPISPHDFLEFSRPGVQHGVYRNLRLGKYEIQAQLDLHGCNVEQARRGVWEFIRDCQDQSVRCALLTHGKGEGRARPALLKSCVNHWLKQLPDVLAFHTAQKHHGGLGATYILLRKSAGLRQKTADKLEQLRRPRR